MAKKKAKKKDMVDDERPSEPPAEVPEPEPEPAPETVLEARSPHLAEEERYAMVSAADTPHGESSVVANTTLGPKTLHIYIGAQRYVHVGETPDGRWVYRPD